MRLLIGVLVAAGLLLLWWLWQRRATSRPDAPGRFPANQPLAPPGPPPPSVATPAPNPAFSAATAGLWEEEFQFNPEANRGSWLLVTSGPDRGKSFKLGGRTLTIGRATSNFVQLSDADVSRLHCQVGFDGQAHRLVDMTSGNGTFVNGQKIRSAVLKDADQIVVGGTTLAFQADASFAKDYVLDRRALGKTFEAETRQLDATTRTGQHSTITTRELLLTVSRLSQVVRSDRQFEDRLSELARTVADVLRADRVVLMRPQGTTWKASYNHAASSLSPEQRRTPPNRDLMALAIQSGEVETSGGVSGTSGRSAAAPVSVQGQVRLLLYTDQIKSGEFDFSEVEVQFLGNVARLALELQN